MTTQTGFDLEDIHSADELAVSDARGNQARGPVLVSRDRIELSAFNTMILIAKRNRLSGPLKIIPSLKITEHQPQLWNEGS